MRTVSKFGHVVFKIILRSFVPIIINFLWQIKEQVCAIFAIYLSFLADQLGYPKKVDDDWRIMKFRHLSGKAENRSSYFFNLLQRLNF